MKKALKPIEFKILKQSFLEPIVEFVEREGINFSCHIVHHLLQRRIQFCNEELWFIFVEQPMRFSLREFIIKIVISFDDALERCLKVKRKNKEDRWMKDKMSLIALSDVLEKQ